MMNIVDIGNVLILNPFGLFIVIELFMIFFSWYLGKLLPERLFLFFYYGLLLVGFGIWFYIVYFSNWIPGLKYS